MKSPLEGTLEKRTAKVARLMSVEAKVVSVRRDAINKKIAEFKAKSEQRKKVKGELKEAIK